MLKIAIIEDAEDNRDLLYYLLRDEFEVLRYNSGEEALQHLVQDIPDLVLLDIRLPGMDGLQVLKHIRGDSRLKHTPVLALTANAMTGDREKYLAAGFSAYASKPIVNIDDFLESVRRLLK